VLFSFSFGELVVFAKRRNGAEKLWLWGGAELDGRLGGIREGGGFFNRRQFRPVVMRIFHSFNAIASCFQTALPVPQKNLTSSHAPPYMPRYG
jgi:hypothetical protein